MKKWFLRLFVAFDDFHSLALSSLVLFDFSLAAGVRSTSSTVQCAAVRLLIFPTIGANHGRLSASTGAAQTRHDRAFFERVEAEELLVDCLSAESTQPRGRHQWMERQPFDTAYECAYIA